MNKLTFIIWTVIPLPHIPIQIPVQLLVRCDQFNSNSLKYCHLTMVWWSSSCRMSKLTTQELSPSWSGRLEKVTAIWQCCDLTLPTPMTPSMPPILKKEDSWITYSVNPSSSVRNLGVLFHCNLSFESHVSSICKTAFFHCQMQKC